jgi:hypothetical protein
VAACVADIDWQAPWLEPWRDVGQPLAAQVAAGRPSFEVLTQAGAAPVQFVPQASLPAGTAYEDYIFNSGCCPTREGVHDFFNALCWMLFPRSKQRLNELQATQIKADGIQNRRGPIRDAITVFDENSALLAAPDALWEALAARQWSHLFGELRPLWQQSRLVVFGHAALEKLVNPYKSITVHVWRVYPATESIADWDAWLAQDLTPEKLASKPFVPLPVLGVPGWWAANTDADFYVDSGVFRSQRHRSVA